VNRESWPNLFASGTRLNASIKFRKSILFKGFETLISLLRFWALKALISHPELKTDHSSENGRFLNQKIKAEIR